MPKKEGNRVIEILARNGIGTSTYIHLNFLKLRKEKKIPFALFDLKKLEKIKDIDEFITYINFSKIDLFFDYNIYIDFCKKIFSDIKKNDKINLVQIITKIIGKFLKGKQKYSENYNPCFIIDGLHNLYNSLYNKLMRFRTIYKLSLIIIYNLEYRNSNQKFIDLLLGNNKDTIILLYNLFPGIYSLPNKFSDYFKNIYPSIENYIKINNLKSEEDLDKFKNDNKEKIRDNIIKYFNYGVSFMNIYVNAISILINKVLSIKNEFIQNIISNLPLNYFDIITISTTKIKIIYSSIFFKKIWIWKKISNESIIDILFNFNDFKFDKFIKPLFPYIKYFDSKIYFEKVKGGIFELGIRQFILKGLSPFGKIEKKIKLIAY